MALCHFGATNFARSPPLFSAIRHLRLRPGGRIRRKSPQFSAFLRSHPLCEEMAPSASGAEGQWFESTRAYHFSSRNSQVPTKSHWCKWTPVPVMCRKVGPLLSTKGSPERTGTVPGGHSGRSESGEAEARPIARWERMEGAHAAPLPIQCAGRNSEVWLLTT